MFSHASLSWQLPGCRAAHALHTPPFNLRHCHFQVFISSSHTHLPELAHLHGQLCPGEGQLRREPRREPRAGSRAPWKPHSSLRHEWTCFWTRRSLLWIAWGNCERGGHTCYSRRRRCWRHLASQAWEGVGQWHAGVHPGFSRPHVRGAPRPPQTPQPSPLLLSLNWAQETTPGASPSLPEDTRDFVLKLISA